MSTAVETKDLAYWRTLAVQAGERLQIAETQLKDLRMAADEARARVTKYKGRLDNANERVNNLNAQLITVSVERDVLQERLDTLEASFAERLARHEVVKRKVHEYRHASCATELVLVSPTTKVTDIAAWCPSKSVPVN